MDWESHAKALADGAVHPASRWYEPVAATPRHLFVPRWWKYVDGDGWTLRDGAEDAEQWVSAAYSDRTLVTRIGDLHADHAKPDDHPTGKPSSSSTLPSLVLIMYRHAMLTDACETLCVTGTGYGTALLMRRLGAELVTSVDVDDYLVHAATERLDMIGLRPQMRVCDITGPLPGEFDRIVSTVSVPSVPASWLAALRPGGRLVTTLANTGLLVTAEKTGDGGAAGRVEWDRAAFMVTRHGTDYPPQGELFEEIRDREGEEVTASPYPVANVKEAWELWSTFTLQVSGVEHWFEQDDGGRRTAWMAHPDGSWARATAVGCGPATVHQGGPRRLWEELDRIRRWWLADGYLNTYGAKVTIAPDGETTLSRGGWSATLTP
jgi:protein-L-isoaspartate O-methyltransferase